MARKSGVLIRQLFGNCSNPCAGLLHHRRLLFSSPPKVVIISQVDDYKRAVKEVEDGFLPGVFYFIRHDRSPMWSVASEKLLDLRKQFPHVTLYKVISIPVASFGAKPSSV
ncbi:uncharacterized protein Pyn_31960 [Prunus yedoensis var. nudiflora]|uniref:Uncharacterized protein n=1 Tax=Prunus yedoensis var. nudiflora TaxID=2094558 RepID=A0A314UI80_PRUYE|nr:uncharacterized protein Pyn_31960 [Prunus yedoensis var. nudiflora]